VAVRVLEVMRDQQALQDQRALWAQQTNEDDRVRVNQQGQQPRLAGQALQDIQATLDRIRNN
jgi:hypothetical protein